MDKNLKIVLFVIIGIMVANLLVSLFGANRNLKNTLEKLSDAEKKLDKAIEQIKDSQIRVDSMQSDLTKFGSYLKDVQGRVELIDLEKRLNDRRYFKQRDSLRARLKDLYITIDTTGAALPEITVDVSRPK